MAFSDLLFDKPLSVKSALNLAVLDTFGKEQLADSAYEKFQLNDFITGENGRNLLDILKLLNPLKWVEFLLNAVYYLTLSFTAPAHRLPQPNDDKAQQVAPDSPPEYTADTPPAYDAPPAYESPPEQQEQTEVRQSSINMLSRLYQAIFKSRFDRLVAWFSSSLTSKKPTTERAKGLSSWRIAFRALLLIPTLTLLGLYRWLSSPIRQARHLRDFYEYLTDKPPVVDSTDATKESRKTLQGTFFDAATEQPQKTTALWATVGLVALTLVSSAAVMLTTFALSTMLPVIGTLVAMVTTGIGMLTLPKIILSLWVNKDNLYEISPMMKLTHSDAELKAFVDNNPHTLNYQNQTEKFNDKVITTWFSTKLNGDTFTCDEIDLKTSAQQFFGFEKIK